MAQVTFNINGAVVSIDDKEYMKGDLRPKLVGEGYYFAAGDPLKRVQNWVPYYQAIDGSTGQPFASLADFTTWVTDNVYVPGEGGAPATIEDGSITEAKLSPALAAKVNRLSGGSFQGTGDGTTGQVISIPTGKAAVFTPLVTPADANAIAAGMVSFVANGANIDVTITQADSGQTLTFNWIAI